MGGVNSPNRARNPTHHRAARPSADRPARFQRYQATAAPRSATSGASCCHVPGDVSRTTNEAPIAWIRASTRKSKSNNTDMGFVDPRIDRHADAKGYH